MVDMLVGRKIKKIPSVNILRVRVDDVSLEDAAQIAVELVESPKKGRYIVTVNPEFVMLAHRNREFARILAKSDLSVADGIGVAVSKLILGGTAQGRVTGVDLLEKVCKIASDKPIKIGFLGGFGDVAEVVAQRQVKKYPGLRVVFAKPGEPTISYDSKLKSDFDRIGRVDVLFVAYGMGKQELWIDRFREKLNIGLYIGVGGAFDVIAGKKKRAPEILQKIGLEWLWRLVHDPVRIWRMRVLPIFGILVFWQFLQKIFLGKNFVKS